MRIAHRLGVVENVPQLFDIAEICVLFFDVLMIFWSWDLYAEVFRSQNFYVVVLRYGLCGFVSMWHRLHLFFYPAKCIVFLFITLVVALTN